MQHYPLQGLVVRMAINDNLGINVNQGFCFSCLKALLCHDLGVIKVNRPFPSCSEPHYESKAKRKVFIMKISFRSYANKTNF